VIGAPFLKRKKTMQKNGNSGALRNSKHRSPKQPLLTVSDVAEWFQVSEAQVRHLLHCGEIPAVRFGRDWRFSHDSLERWVLDAIRTRDICATASANAGRNCGCRSSEPLLSINVGILKNTNRT
jgi:excisionase family DNA binding protein